MHSLHRHIPRSVLPEEYGGTAGPLDMRAWSRLLLDCEEEFIVEFCQPDPLEGVVLPDSMLFDGEQAGGGQDEDTFRGLRSQLYYCYWGTFKVHALLSLRGHFLFHLKHVCRLLQGKLPILYIYFSKQHYSGWMVLSSSHIVQHLTVIPRQLQTQRGFKKGIKKD